MHDQHLGTMIMKGFKVIRLFLLSFVKSPWSFLHFIYYNYAIVNFKIWDKHLGHPNSHVLHNLLKYVILGNKESPSLHAIQFDCNSCKLGKSKILSFPTHQSNAKQAFNMIHNDL